MNKRVYAGRPHDRSFAAYTAWVGNFARALVPSVKPSLRTPDQLRSSIRSWRMFWASADGVARRLTGR